MMKRLLCFAYGLAAYALFLGAFLYLIAFLANAPAPKTIDSRPAGDWLPSLAINSLLLLAFGVHHSVFARPAVKRWWTKFVPEPIERSTYVLVSSALMIALMLLWRPLPATIWQIDHPWAQAAMWTLFAGGWALILYGSFLIDHFELFGVRQVFMHLLGKPNKRDHFVTPALYRVIRHPLMLGWLIAFWATPQMSVGHFLFALVNSGYILVGIFLEERTLSAIHGTAYQRWRASTPMLLPLPIRRRPAGGPVSPARKSA